MASSSIFITAAEARQNPIRESVIHDETRMIESAVIEAVKNGYYQATLSSGSPMTGHGNINAAVASVDLVTNAFFIPSHPFKSGDIVTLTSTGTLPSPLVSTNFYSVIYVGPDHIKLATSAKDANKPIPVDIDFTMGVESVYVTNPGAGYLRVPTVGIAPPQEGNTATAIATLTKFGIIDSVAVVAPGEGYVKVPSVEISSQGTGASATFIWFTTVSATIEESGQGYRIGDVLTCYPGDPNSATTATVTSVGANGSVLDIRLTTAGDFHSLVSGTNVPTDVFPYGGTGCTLNFLFGISRIDVEHGGLGYVAPPKVTIESDTGSGAMADAIINAGTVIGFNITAQGTGYNPSGTITITITSGNGATASAVLQPTGVGQIVVTNDGSGSYRYVPSVDIVAAGSGASAGIISMLVVDAKLTNAGGGYIKGNVLLVAGGAGTEAATIQVTGVGSLGEILSYALITSGCYTSLPILNSNAVLGGAGHSAAFSLTMGIKSIELASNGQDYVSPPVVVINSVNSKGSGATAYANMLNGTVDSITVTNSGLGYTEIPEIEITSGSGATAVAVLDNGSIIEVLVTSAGQNYTSPPSVQIPGIATAESVLIPTGIARITVLDPGSDYSGAPQLQVIPNQDSNGVVQPTTVVNIGYSVDHVSVTSPGSGYNIGTDVFISGPTGNNSVPAQAQAMLGINSGTIVVSLYEDSRDYYKVWKNQNPSNSFLNRPYQERMDTVIAYFTNLGYTISRQTNPATGNTIQWVILW